MKFDVYCDESRPDLLGSQSPKDQYLLIGSLWLAREHRESFKSEIHRLRNRHRIGGEFKWGKVSPSKVDFYADLIKWFFSRGDALRFRCIAVDRSEVNLLRFHNSSQELGFYKFYYQMLHHWIFDNNQYAVFCDFKRNRERDRLEVLRECLKYSNLSSDILSVQATKSRESVLIQLVDVLTGATGARINSTLNAGSAKETTVKLIEHRLGKPINATGIGEKKFNVFVIDLKGGW